MIRNTHFFRFPEGDAPAGGSGGGAATPTPPVGADAAPGEVIGIAGSGVDIKKSGVPKGAETFRDASSKFLKEKGLTRAVEPATTDADETEDTDELPADASPEEREAVEAAKNAELELAALETAEETAARHADEQAQREKEAKATTDPAKTAEEPPAEPEKPAITPEKIVLKGLSERNEPDIPLEIDDPEVATRIKRLQNDGMRRATFDEAMKDVDSRSAELLAIEDALKEDPVAYTLAHIGPDRQLELARALLLDHFDALEPDIADLSADPAARHKLRADLKDRLHRSGDVLRASMDRQTRANQIFAKVKALVPDSVPPDEARLFLADAERDLVAEVKAGRPVTPENVAQVLARRVQMYNYATAQNAIPAATNGNGVSNGASPGPGGKAGDGVPPRTNASPATVRPVGDRAKELAAKREVARLAQERIRRAQSARRTASRVAPPGAGAGAVSMPAVPATADIREASKAIRRALAPGGGWPTSG